MSFTVALGQPIHLLVDGSTDVRCGTDDVTYVTSNADAVTCPACVEDEPDNDNEPHSTVPLSFALEVTTPEELRAWRKRHKLSQHKLGELLDISWMSIFRWEKGKWPIPRTISLALAYLEQRLA